MTRWLVVMLGLAAAPVRADDCTKQVVAARGEADRLLKKGAAKEALAMLVAAKDACSSLAGAPLLWLLSDLSLAAYKAGDNEACASYIGEAESDVLTKNPKAAKALLHNAELCAPQEGGCDYKLDSDKPLCAVKLAVEYSERNPYAFFSSPACPIKGYPKAVAIAAQSGAARSCVGLTEYAMKRKPDQDPDEAFVTCPKLFVVSEQNGKAQRTILDVASDVWWTDASDCCAAQKLMVAKAKPNSIVLTSSGVHRDCFGGTAATDFFTVLKLVGNALTVEKDLSIGWH